METIIFDVDDTLYDQLLPFKNAVKDKIDDSFSNEEITLLYLKCRKYSDEVFEKHMSGEITASQLQTYRIIMACRDFGIELSENEALAFQEAYLSEQKQISLINEIETLFNKLHDSGKQLAVLTNGEHGHQMMKVKQLGIEKWVPIDRIFVSGSIGYSKPDLNVFRHIENKLELSKENIIYIGDSFENDVVGAKTAGWQAIWFNHRRRTVNHTKWQADHVVNNPKDLLAIFQ
ncbi:HAD family hydrolase [Gracilibacillus xinjiangensis]|uniref:HAD family hydrolase n=1 Tax=Gracilibacillus xinjiangensis TaxID=1193282 RepID=A0ABV8WRZ1_9BACI